MLENNAIEHITHEEGRLVHQAQDSSLYAYQYLHKDYVGLPAWPQAILGVASPLPPQTIILLARVRSTCIKAGWVGLCSVWYKKWSSISLMFWATVCFMGS